jgi:hypothetical protein
VRAGLLLIMIGLVFGLDVVNVGASFLDEGPVAWILVGVGTLVAVGSSMTRRTHR